MIGIVSGPDRAGKTPLIQLTLERAAETGFSTRYLRVPQPPPTTPVAFRTAMEEIEKWDTPPFSRLANMIGLYDRFPLIDEPIYKPLVSNTGKYWDRIYEGSLQLLAGFSRAYQVPLIYVCPPDIISRNLRQPDPFIPADLIPLLVERYERAIHHLRRCGMAVMEVRKKEYYTRDDADDILTWIKGVCK